jgi:hypothetical protein
VSRAHFAKPCAAAPARAIERAVRHLLGEGYGVEEQANAQARLVFMRGSRTDVHLDRYRHHLDLSADGTSLTFDFHAGAGSSGYLTKKERSKLDQIASATAAAARDRPPPPPSSSPDEASFRCRYCGALTPMEEPSCKACGEANFS